MNWNRQEWFFEKSTPGRIVDDVIASGQITWIALKFRKKVSYSAYYLERTDTPFRFLLQMDIETYRECRKVAIVLLIILFLSSVPL